MTGLEIGNIRKRAGLTQEQFGLLAGVNRITVCRWEKMGSNEISAYKGKEQLQGVIRFLLMLANVQQLDPMKTQEVIPAPFSFAPYVDEGEPIVLSCESVAPGDLALVCNTSDNRPVRMGIVSTNNKNVVTLYGADNSIYQTDTRTYCRLIQLVIHRPYGNL